MHDDDCEQAEYDGGICTCTRTGAVQSDAAYFAEPSNMADLEDGITSSEMW